MQKAQSETLGHGGAGRTAAADYQGYTHFGKFLSQAFCGGSKIAKIRKIKKNQENHSTLLHANLNNILTFF